MHQRTFFMLLKATAHWRALDADAQRGAFDDALMIVFNRYPELRMSRFNADAFHGRCSHVIVWEASTDAECGNTSRRSKHCTPDPSSPHRCSRSST
jgi:hypothetical protein